MASAGFGGKIARAARLGVVLIALGALTGCATFNRLNPFSGQADAPVAVDAQTGGAAAQTAQSQTAERVSPRDDTGADGTIWDLFANRGDSGTQTRVNRYLWTASLDVLSFLPVETVDPFTGVIVMGYGTPPGGRAAYRATVHISDPALDARALRLAMQGRDGTPVAAPTLRAVEDAILTRARELRSRDSQL